MSIKLTDTQLVLLGAAAQRQDLCLVAPPTLKGANKPQDDKSTDKSGAAGATRAGAHPDHACPG
jgi:hypothetical protein